MADKEATVYIVDVGLSMGWRNKDRVESDLDWSLPYIFDRITTTVGLNRKTTYQAVIGLRTNKSDNFCANLGDAAYDNISVLQPLKALAVEDVRALQAQLKPSKVEVGDAFSAIALATHMLMEHCKKLKYIKRIVLVTNATGPLDDEGLGQMIKKLRDESIEILILGIDVEEGYSPFDKNGNADRDVNIPQLHAFAQKAGGKFGNMADALEEMENPRIKSTKLVASYSGSLTLGDPAGDPQHVVSIDVQRYPRVKVAKAPTASNYVVRSNAKSGHGTDPPAATPGPDPEPDAADPDAMVGLRTERHYEIIDPDPELATRTVPASDLVKGFEYGRTAVFIDESDRSILDLETATSMQIIGFIDQATFPRYMAMGETNVVVPAKHDAKAILAFASLYAALRERESYAVVRFVPKDGKAPAMHVLAPVSPEDDALQCLVDVALPFAEDMRPHRFPPLDRVVTVSGKVLREHRTLPTPELQAAVDAYVDAMDVTEMHEKGVNEGPWAELEDVFSPMVHRIDHAVRHRAVFPDRPGVVSPRAKLTKWVRPPQFALDASAEQRAKLRTVADIKKVPPKSKARLKHGQTAGGDVTAADVTAGIHAHGAKKTAGAASNGSPLADRTRATSAAPTIAAPLIEPDNAIPSMRRALDAPAGPDTLARVLREMGAVIEARVRDSVGHMDYDRAVEELGRLREAMVEMEEWHAYNEWARAFRDRLLNGDLNGDRRNFWERVRKGHLGLIGQQTLALSTVSPEEAAEFYKFTTA